MTLFRALRRLPPLETAILIAAIAVLAWVGVAGQSATSGDRAPLDSFSSFDAASGGYRAFYELLEREDVRVDRFELRPGSLGDAIDTLVYVEPLVYDPRQVFMTKSDVAALEGWVRGGGRLLYIGHDDDAARHGVLHLPASTLATGARGSAYVAPALAADGIAHVAASTGLRWKRTARASILVGDAGGAVAVTYPFGRGRVTAVIDEGLFRNDAIGAGDRARLAYALARPGRPGGVVSFDELAHGYALPSRWWTLVPRAFAIALVAALAIVALAIAGAAVRFGPPLVPVERRDRSSADFIDALSSLLERGRAARKALVDAEASATRAIARSFALDDRAPKAEIAARIETPQTRDAYRALVALADSAASNARTDPAAFVRGVALAQQLRKEFAAHGRPRI